MGIKRVVLCCFLLFGLSNAVEVNIDSDWIPNVGWEVICDWALPPNDRLQSVRLYQNSQQLMIYRPEKHGPVKTLYYNNNTDNNMKLNCQQTVEMGLRGKCVLSIELLKPPRNEFTYICEVSGERPWFNIGKKEHIVHPLVTPSNAVLDVSEQTTENSLHIQLNCTSSGLPTPNLIWTIGDQRIPPNFTGNLWNSTSKLFQVWSFLDYTPQSDVVEITCTPETISTSGQLAKGESAKYSKNGASVLCGVNKIILLFFLCLGLQR